MRWVVFLVTLVAAGLVMAAPARAIDYQLPYPGLLPDSPVYFLKVVRDRITVFFLRSPKDKAFYYLLLADKRAAAAQALALKKANNLAVVTLEKARDYFAQSLGQVPQIKNETDREDFLSKLVVSGAKHGEISTDIAQRVSGTEGERLEKVRRDQTDLNNRVMEMFLRNLKFEI